MNLANCRPALLPVLLLLVVSTAHSQSSGRFLSPEIVDAAATSSVAGDFDGDGKQDLVIGGSGKLKIYLDRINGYQLRSTYEFEWPTPQAVADFNGDGKLDLVLRKGGSGLLVLTGNGDGTFREGPVLALTCDGSYACEVHAGDINRDGRPDLIVLVSGRIVAFLSKGPDGFSESTPVQGIPECGGPFDFARFPGCIDTIALGDFDGDGALDLASTINWFGPIFVWKGRRDLTFSLEGHFSGFYANLFLGATPRVRLLADDVDGDKRSDIIVMHGEMDIFFLGGSSQHYDAGLRVFLGDGKYTFTQAAGIQLPQTHGLPAATALAPAPKRIVAEGGGGVVAVLTPTTGGSYTVQNYQTTVGVSSLNPLVRGDRVDLLVGGAVLHSSNALGLQAPLSVPTARLALVEDFNDDGRADIVQMGTDAISVYLHTEQGLQLTQTLSCRNVSRAKIADLNSDGHQDIVAISGGSTGCTHQVCYFSRQKACSFLGDGQGQFTSKETELEFYGGGQTLEPAVGDLNRDGNLDVIVSTVDTGFSSFFYNPRPLIAVLLGKGDGAFSEITYDFPAGGREAASNLSLADFDGDTVLDLLTGTNDGQLNLFRGLGDGRLAAPQPIGSTLYANMTGLAAGRFHRGGNDGHRGGNDGHRGGNDAAVGFEGGVAILANTGGALTQTATLPVVTVTSVAVGDLDGDGNDDLVATSEESLLVFLGDGNGNFGQPTAYRTGPGTSVCGRTAPPPGVSSPDTRCAVVVKDWNNDGASDVLFTTPSALNVYLNTGGNLVALRNSPASSLTLQPVTLEATVSPTVLSERVPGGRITFEDVGAFPVAILGTVPLISGRAELKLPGMTAGLHHLQARYSGDGTLNPARSNIVQQNVSMPGQSSQLPEQAARPGGLGPGCSLPAAIAAQARTSARQVRTVGKAGGVPGQSAMAAQGKDGNRRGDFKIKKPLINTLVDPAPAMPTASVLAELVTHGGGAFTFDGIDHADSRNAGGGQNTSAEPPDQAIAVSPDQVLQAVNNAVSVYRKDGTRIVGPIAINAFFGLPPAINRDADGNPVTFGPFVADPRALFDVDTGRWFVTALYVDIEPQLGTFLNSAALIIAVSESSDATQPFRIYSIDITDEGYGKCPCLGDQPLLGVNRDGIYISTNQFTLRDLEFQTALILAIDKHKLAAGEPTTATGFQNLTVAGVPAFSVQPAIAAPGTSASGVEFFMNTLDFSRAGDNRVAVWALTDTRKLQLGRTDFTVEARIVQVPAYGVPGTAEQKPGPAPLRDELNTAGVHEELERLDTNDDRLQQVYWTGNTLHAALTSALDVSGKLQSGVAWLQVDVAADQCSFTANTVRTGYLALAGADLFFPAVSMASAGTGVLALNVGGVDRFPSFGYVRMSSTAGAESRVYLTAIGKEPEDGFSGYRTFGGDGVARWGDYCGATVSPDGQLWIAGEYIPVVDRARSKYANWGTVLVKLP